MKRNYGILIMVLFTIILLAGCSNGGKAIKSMQNMLVTVNNSERFAVVSQAALNAGERNITVDMPEEETLSLKEYLETGFAACDWSFTEDYQNGLLVTFSGIQKHTNTFYYYIWSVDTKNDMYWNVAVGNENGTTATDPEDVERAYNFYWPYFYGKYGTQISNLEQFKKEQIATSKIMKMIGMGVY